MLEVGCIYKTFWSVVIYMIIEYQHKNFAKIINLICLQKLCQSVLIQPTFWLLANPPFCSSSPLLSIFYEYANESATTFLVISATFPYRNLV
jgi:hypothetical protein